MNLKSVAELALVHLELLASGQVVAIIIDDVATKEEAQRYCDRIRIVCEQSKYLWKSDLKATARSVGEAHESFKFEREYFEGSRKSDSLNRETIYEGQSPVDKIAEQFNQFWPEGVTVARKNKDRFLSEISRRWKMHGGAHPHIDQSRTALLGSLGISVRFGINVYLNMPPKGGEIEFWHRYISDTEYEELKRSDYGVNREDIGSPDVRFRPAIGQAVIFRADRPHAVAPINTGLTDVSQFEDRITNACFLGITDSTKPILRFA